MLILAPGPLAVIETVVYLSSVVISLDGSNSVEDPVVISLDGGIIVKDPVAWNVLDQ